MTQSLNFPARIYQILENESAEIVQWNANGLSFRIVDHIRFESEVIPKYFRHRKISSVQRQLNVYGFRSISRGEHKRSFYHPLFKRGNWEVVKQMGRYLPANKNEKGEGDENHIDNLPTVLAAAAPVPAPTLIKNDRNSYFVSNFAAPQAFIAAHFSYNDTVQNEGAAQSPVTKKNASIGSTGTVKVMVNSDLFSSEHHYATDFIPQTEKGHELTNVLIQPVDYSIPMLFPTAPRGVRSAPAVECSSCDEANSSSSSVYYTPPNPLRQVATQPEYATSAAIKQEAGSLCDWAVADPAVDAWAEMLFDLECVDSSNLLDFPLKSEPIATIMAAPCSLNLSLPCWDGKSAPGGLYADSSNSGGEEGEGMERLRRDSFADVLSFCADLF